MSLLSPRPLDFGLHFLSEIRQLAEDLDGTLGVVGFLEPLPRAFEAVE
jgi:hypothetical protein